jgi:DNA-binding response OmpR family regulator
MTRRSCGKPSNGLCVKQDWISARFFRPATVPKRSLKSKKGSLDLILSDINMPVMDGLEFLKSIAGVEAAKGVPVVMITTEGSEARVVEALSAGARGYLRKPFTPEQVKERVTPLLAAAV